MIRLSPTLSIVQGTTDAFYAEFRPDNFEVLAVKHGLKPAVRILVEREHEESFCNALTRSGLFVGRSTVTVLDEGSRLAAGAEGRRIVYASRSKDLIGELKRADHESPFENSDAMGDLLGYPKCCARRFARSTPRSYSEFIRDTLDRSRRLDSLLNILDSNLCLLPHYPCSFSCARSMKYARRLLDLLDRVYPGTGAKIARYLRGSFVYLPSANSYLRLQPNGHGASAGYSPIILCLAGYRLDDGRAPDVDRFLGELRRLANGTGPSVEQVVALVGGETLPMRFT